MTSLGALKVILMEQEKCCKALVDLLQKERAYLIDFEVGGIEELAKGKDTLLFRLRLLEEERVRLTAAIAAAPGGPPADVTLRGLVDRTGDAELAGIRLKLVSLAQSIEDLNSFNRHLIDRSLGSVRCATGFFQAFGGPLPERSGCGALVSRET
ncbi:MAG: flagellar export chaperone FlgN [Candidatus Deferrimicrobiaceae bacterium]